MAAHHWKMSQHLEIIDCYGHVVSLKLLLQSQLNTLSVQRRYNNSCSIAECAKNTSAQTCRH